MFVEKIIKKFSGWLLRATLKFFILAGVLLIAISVGLGIILDAKLLAVLVSSFGTLVGTLLLSMLFPELLKKEFKVARERENRSAKALDGLRSYQDKILQLERDIEREKAMCVDVNSYKTNLTLGVLECDMKTTDFKEKILDERVSGLSEKFFNRKRTETYYGVLHKEFKAVFGVELGDLRFSNADDHTILVSGLKAKSQGRKNEKNLWKIAQVQVHKIPVKNLASKAEEVSVILSHPELSALKDEQEKELRERIDKGIENENILRFVEEQAKHFLRIIFSPQRMTLVFVDQEGQDALPLNDFLGRLNQKREETIRQIEAERSRLQNPVSRALLESG